MLHGQDRTCSQELSFAVMFANSLSSPSCQGTQPIVPYPVPRPESPVPRVLHQPLSGPASSRSLKILFIYPPDLIPTLKCCFSWLAFSLLLKRSRDRSLPSTGSHRANDCKQLGLGPGQTPSKPPPWCHRLPPPMAHMGRELNGTQSSLGLRPAF